MNDITYAVSVDVNNPIIPYNVYVASVLDSNVRYLEITLYQNGNVITLSNTATATASLVTDDVLIDDSVECTISNNIITVPLEDLQRHGNLDVQVTVTEDTKVLAIPFPIQVRVTPNIAENAQINENSLGSYAEVVHEIAEARGTYTTLHDAIAAKLSAAPGAVDTENLADESITVAKVADDLAAVINAKEVKSNKKTTLTGNESSNDYYPTTKAVADALRALEQTGVSPQAIIAAVNTYLEEHGITQSALYEMLDQTLSGDNTNIPALLLDNDNQAGDYILYYVDSEETRHELFNFSQYFYTKARVDAKLANKADTSALASGLAQKADVSSLPQQSNDINDDTGYYASPAFMAELIDDTISESIFIENGILKYTNGENVTQSLGDIKTLFYTKSQVDSLIPSVVDGKSAYEIAIEHGYDGTEEEWLEYLVGIKRAYISAQDGNLYVVKPGRYYRDDDGNPGSEPDVHLRLGKVRGDNGSGYRNAHIDDNGDLIIIEVPSSGEASIVNLGHVVGAKGDTGATGADGYSPTATVTQTQNGATVSITDKNGTTTANISNGVNGSDYILTAQDKSDIADLVLAALPTTQGVLYGNTSN